MAPLKAERLLDRLEGRRPELAVVFFSARRSLRDLTAVHPSPSIEEEGLVGGDGTTTMDFSLLFPKWGCTAWTAGERGGAALEHSPRSRIRAGAAGLAVDAGRGGCESGTCDGPVEITRSGTDAGVPQPEPSLREECTERQEWVGESGHMTAVGGAPAQASRSGAEVAGGAGAEEGNTTPASWFSYIYICWFHNNYGEYYFWAG